MEIHGRILRIVRWHPIRVLPLETLVTRPGLEQRAVHRKVFIGEQAVTLDRGDFPEESVRDVLRPPCIRQRPFFIAGP
jgi:hypothetical protein